MGRKVEYFCDACSTSFGEMNHINVKNSDVRLSYPTQTGHWAQKKIPAACKEYHFCTVNCLRDWLKRQLDAIKLEKNEIIV